MRPDRGVFRQDGESTTFNERLSRIEMGQRALEAGHDETAGRMAELPEIIRTAVSQGIEAGARAIVTNPELLDAFWAAAVQRGQRGLHEQAGRWLFSKWTAIIALVFLMGQVMGWPVVIKALLGIGISAKGG